MISLIIQSKVKAQILEPQCRVELFLAQNSNFKSVVQKVERRFTFVHGTRMERRVSNSNKDYVPFVREVPFPTHVSSVLLWGFNVRLLGVRLLGVFLFTYLFGRGLIALRASGSTLPPLRLEFPDTRGRTLARPAACRLTGTSGPLIQVRKERGANLFQVIGDFPA